MANSHILVGASASPARPVVRRIFAVGFFISRVARGVDDFFGDAEPRDFPLLDLSAARPLSDRDGR